MKLCMGRISLRTTWARSLLVSAVLFPGILCAQGGAIRTPNYEIIKQEVDSGQKGKEAAERFKQGGEQGKQGKNKYRGGSDEDPSQNMSKLFEKILYPQGGNVDKWYSPHLRDSQYPEPARLPVAMFRAQAGAAVIVRTPFCTVCANGLGTPKTACTECQPPPIADGCPGQEWYDQDIFQECCRKNTEPYKERVTDSNFKLCCVLKAERDMPTEYISCKHPSGDGWAGLFEYYYPTAALGWENDRTTTMIASKNEVNKCLGESNRIMEQRAEWVEKAVKKNLEIAQRLKDAQGGAPPPGGGNQAATDILSKIQEDIKTVRPQDNELRFTDSLQSEGLTLRVNFPAMTEAYRRRLARHFCMRDEQFLKLMDPAWDPVQKPFQGGQFKEPVWSNYCPEGVKLMTDPEESAQLRNIDETPTQMNFGTFMWMIDPLYCQRLNASKNPFLNEFFGEVIARSDPGWGGNLSAGDTGYTCGEKGKLNGSLVPVEMYRHAAVERRTAIDDHALGFMMAGGLYPGEMLSGIRSFYKRFEPQEYSMLFGIFRGKQFVGAGGGPKNEEGRPCDPVNGENFVPGAPNRSDRLYISDFTHKDVFTKEIVNKPGNKEYDNYVQEWAEKSGEQKITNRGLDEKSSNYAAAFRIFATCPRGYVRWRHPDPTTNSLAIDPICGEEHLGGKHPPIF